MAELTIPVDLTNLSSWLIFVLTNHKFELNCLSRKGGILAVHLSVIKRLKQSRKTNLRNRNIKSKIKTLIKKLETSSDLDQAQTNFREAVSLLDKAARLKVMHKKTAARIKTRLARWVNKFPQSSEEKKG